MGRVTLLLVDDEDMVLGVGSEMLEVLGYDVLTAQSGQEAVRIFKMHQGKINMVILDMIMPGMGGGETYERIKEIDPGIKVLLTSGYDINGQAEEILNRGCSGFIQKPFDIQMLSRKLMEILV